MAVLHTNEWATEAKQADYQAFLDYCERFRTELTDFEKIKEYRTGFLVFQKISERFYKTALGLKNAIRKMRGV